MKVLLFSLILITALFVSPKISHAQVLYATIVGNVTDPSNAPIPGAAVKIVNTGTRQEWSMQANDAGVYSISTVPAGQYDITVMVTGFQTHT